MVFDFDAYLSERAICSGPGFWIIYIIFVLVLGIISISLTASLLRNKDKTTAYTVHVFTCILFFIAALLIVTGWKWLALLVSLIELSLAVGAFVGVKPDNIVSLPV